MQKKPIRRGASKGTVPALVAASMTGAEVAQRFGLPLEALKVIRRTLHSAIAVAVESGVPVGALAEFAGEEIRPYLEDGIRTAYATPEEGLTALLQAQGGCVGVSQACILFRRPKPVTRQALTAQIRSGNVIGYLTGGEQYVVPVWQFRREGGVVEGLPEILRLLRENVAGADQLTPFTFFLQADPVTDGRPPIVALRSGELAKVREAVLARVA
jgi:hypothetical protein